MKWFIGGLADAGVRIASENKLRALSKELITTEVVAEIAPFTHSLKGGGKEVKPCAITYIKYLPDKIFELLDQHSKYVATYRHNMIIEVTLL